MVQQHEFSRRIAVSVVVLLIIGLTGCSGTSSISQPLTAAANNNISSSSKITVVAAENFYGDILAQLGGKFVSVTSILSDPNIDPHEYESNVQNGVAVSKAQLVIQNGDGYDTWMDKLLSASPSPQRVSLIMADIAKKKLPDNEHYWYSLDNIQAIAVEMANSLEKIDPANKSAYEENLSKFQQSLVPVQQKMTGMKTKYSGDPVGLTETIFLYQTGPMGLKVMTPLEFEKAIAEGNDPPADTIITANDQIAHHEIKVLIYNNQTVTPITTHLQDAAKSAGIPVVGVTETMPVGKTYQQWMLDQLNALDQALSQP